MDDGKRYPGKVKPGRTTQPTVKTQIQLLTKRLNEIEQMQNQGKKLDLLVSTINDQNELLKNNFALIGKIRKELMDQLSRSQKLFGEKTERLSEHFEIFRSELRNQVELATERQFRSLEKQISANHKALQKQLDILIHSQDPRR